VWLPLLKPGQYEFVIDNHPFKIGDDSPFDPNKDLRSSDIGEIFTVTNAPIVWSVDPLMIKLAAAESLKAAVALQDLADFLEKIWELKGEIEPKKLGEKALEMGLEKLCEYLEIECITDYNGWVIEKGAGIMREIGKSLELKYGTIILDPPDPNFTAVVGLDFAEVKGLGYPYTPVAERTVPQRMHSMAQHLATQAVAYEALVPTMEKVQGAILAGNNLWALQHAEKLKAYAELAVIAGDDLAADIDALEVELGANLDLGPGLATVNGWIDDVKANGYTEEDRDYFRSFGFSEADIDGGMAAFAETKLAVEEPNMGNLLKQARATFTTIEPALVDLAGQAEMVRVENEAIALRLGPRLSLSAAPAGMVGVPVQLAATAKHIYAEASPTAGTSTSTATTTTARCRRRCTRRPPPAPRWSASA
jgi:hypothetical protein